MAENVHSPAGARLDKVSTLQTDTSLAPPAPADFISFEERDFEQAAEGGSPPGEGRGAPLDRSAVSEDPRAEGVSDVTLTHCQGAEDVLDGLTDFLDDVLPSGSGRAAGADEEERSQKPALLAGSEEGRRRERVRMLDALIAEAASNWRMDVEDEPEEEVDLGLVQSQLKGRAAANRAWGIGA